MSGETNVKIRDAGPVSRYGYIEPMPIMEALERLWATIARGSEGNPWYSPREGYVEVRWLNRKGCYRFTLDLMPPGTRREDQA